VICPHCARTIAEQDRYLMSRAAPGEDVEMPDWLWKAVAVVGALVVVIAYLTYLVA
jgi:hypothetical protein